MKARLLTIVACAMMGRRQRRARALGARRRRDVLPRRPRAAMPGGRLPMPRGWCYATRCTFYGDGRAIIWHDGRGDKSKKLVITNSTFDAKRPTPLGRYHHDAQFFLLNCRLSDMIIDSNIAYAYTDKVLDPCPWGRRTYYYGCSREGAGRVAHGQSRQRAGLPGVPRRDCPLDVRRQVGPREAHTRAVAGACLLTAMPPGTRERRRRRAGAGSMVTPARRHFMASHPAVSLRLALWRGCTAVTPTLSSKGALRRCRSKRG